MRHLFLFALLLLAACEDTSFYSLKEAGTSVGDLAAVEASLVDVGSSGLPDGLTLYKCTNIGKSCNAHDACAIDPICGKDGLCRPTLVQNCDDGLPCTTDTCLGQGVCSNLPKAGMCKLAVRVPKGTTCKAMQSDGGVQMDAGAANDAGVTPGDKETIFCCFNSGERNPADNCQQCNPPASSDSGIGGSSATAWSAANGGYCDDGDACTMNDFCKAGTCAGTSFASKCSDGVSCTTDLCDGKGGCLGNTLKSDYCLINNTCYKANAANPSGQCEACVPLKSQSAWTPVSNTCTISSKCYVKGAKHTAGCAECDPAMSLTSWVVKGSTHCLINDTCLASGAKDSTGCSSCQPSSDRYDYTALPGMCKIDSKCYQTGDKHPQGCAQCDASVSTDKWTVKVTTHCLVNNVCVASGTKDPTPGSCSSCQPGVNRYDYSADAGYCKIDGKCELSGTAHPQGCATCDPKKSASAWTPKTASDCVLNGNCHKMCGATCADVLSNPSHCGGCNKGCSSGLFCVAGVCGQAAPDCKTIKAGNAAAKDGVYTMYTGGSQTFSAYCDMTSDGGGWTLVARFSNADGSQWIDTGKYWYTQTTELGKPTVRNENKDALSQAFWTVKGTEFKISRTDRSNDAALLRTTGSCLGGKTFRDKIKSYGNFLTGVWATNAVRGTCDAVLSNYSGTSGFGYATCTGTIGKANAISFFSDYSSGDGAVLMIGGGGSACARADHGIAVTEANAAAFGTTYTRKDFGEVSPTGSTAYSLNLFVR